MMYNREDDDGGHDQQYDVKREEENPLIYRQSQSQSNLGSNGPTRRRKNGVFTDPAVSAPNFVAPSKEEDGEWKSLPLYKRGILQGVCGSQWCCGPSILVNDEHYYRDTFNDESFSWTLGTKEEDGIWMNTEDKAGTIMAWMVWLLFAYSALTITFLAESGGIPVYWSMIYCTFCVLALACHAKTQWTDPGSVPASAQPRPSLQTSTHQLMCSQCQTFKPPFSHHCRICNRCVSRMDHHCPWMNNCIGARNFKHFILFLLYTWICSTMSLLLLGWNYFFCVSDECIFSPVLIPLARLMTLLSTGSFLFSSSMLMNVVYGIMTGIGTIDRLKKKANGSMSETEEEMIPLPNIFGTGGYASWLIPLDPIFPDYDAVVGYSTPQRLLREQLRDPPPRDNKSTVAESVYSANEFLPV